MYRLCGLQIRRLVLAISVPLLARFNPVLAQHVTLSLSSGTTQPGLSVTLTASITSTGGAVPSAIQWTIGYPADVTGVVVTANQKSVVCASSVGSTNCVLYGLDANVLSNGVIASASFAISPGSTNTAVPVTVSGIAVSDPTATLSYPASGTGGTITIVQPTPVTLSAVSCSPTSVSAPGTSTCIATLSGGAPSGGLAVTLSSSSVKATVPTSVTVTAGATTGSFVATVLPITTDQTATITASANGTSRTFTLNLVAPAQLISLTCAPTTLASGASSACTVSLNKSPAGATSIAVSSNAGVLAVPGSVTIPGGQSSAIFQAVAGAIAVGQNALVTAALNGQSQSAGVTLVAAPTPSADSVSPGAGSGPAGTTQTFSFVFSDSQSASNLSAAVMLFASSLAYPNACAVIYDRTRGTVQLEWDGATGADVKPVNSTVALQNSQCSIGATGVTSTTLSNTITLAITFKPTFDGPKNIYMYGADNNGAINTGWVQRGTYTVATASAPVPTADSASPSSATGTAGATQTFSFVFSDSQSAANLSVAAILFAPTLTYPNSCFVIYDHNRGTLQLEWDGVTGADARAVGSTTTLQNSQCAVGAATVVTSGLSNTITLDITFKTAFSGLKNIYLYGADTNGTINTGWVQRGTYTVNTVSAPVPAAVSASPSAGGGGRQTFTFVFSDSQSAANLSVAAILFAPSLAYANSCFVIYDKSQGTLQLEWDNVTGADLRPVSSTVVLQNSQCSIGTTTVTPSTLSITITMDVTFTPAFSGLKDTFMYGGDTDGTINTGWVQRGTWTPF